MTIGRFLAGIGALIWDPATEEYLLLRRAARKDFGANTWECVTGRVDQGESFEQALHREVLEEIGAQVQIEFFISTTHFYRGAELPEYELLGVLYGCTLLSGRDFTFGDEHSEMRWMSAENALASLPEGYWLRTLIEQCELLKKRLPGDVRFALRDQFQRAALNFLEKGSEP
jgi:8-oxo-dGTP diphosphatase